MLPSPCWILISDTQANQLLSKYGNLVKNLDKSLICVLPKLRTAQLGITVRSLSLHLAAEVSPVAVQWQSTANTVAPAKSRLNLLLLPWPLIVEDKYFKETEAP